MKKVIVNNNVEINNFIQKVGEDVLPVYFHFLSKVNSQTKQNNISVTYDSKKHQTKNQLSLTFYKPITSIDV